MIWAVRFFARRLEEQLASPFSSKGTAAVPVPLDLDLVADFDLVLDFDSHSEVLSLACTRPWPTASAARLTEGSGSGNRSRILTL